MAIHLLRDLDQLKKEILLLGAMVEEATHKAILTVVDHRAELAAEVIAGDRDVDDREVQVEDECLKVLALHQPVANDLRFVLAVLKVNNDLERMGDLARNIAERGRDLAGLPEKVAVPAEIRTMAERVRRMLRDSLNAVVQSDTGLARRVLDEDVVIGLGVGADDYVTKPFKPRELVARVRAVLRRGALQDERHANQRLVCAGVVIDPLRHEVLLDGAPVPFTATEFRLLHLLASHPGRVFTRDQLVSRVIGDGAVVIDRNIDVHIRSIRKKLGPYRDLVMTIRGVGYRFRDEDS